MLQVWKTGFVFTVIHPFCGNLLTAIYDQLELINVSSITPNRKVLTLLYKTKNVDVEKLKLKVDQK